MPEAALLADLVQPDRVHGTLYTDPEIYAAELDRIWFRTWVYVGHESEVPGPGDRVIKSLGPRVVAMSRDDRGGIRVGDLPRVDDYRGFVFASVAAEGPTLAEHLGDAAIDALDRLLILSPEGEVEITCGWIQHKVKANWKMLVENETDGYHPSFVHDSILQVSDLGIGDLYNDKSPALSRDLGNGHTELDLRPAYRETGQPLGWFGASPERLPEYVARMHEIHGDEADRILVDGSPHVMIFPNLFIAEVQMFVLQPLAVDRTVQHVTALQFKGAPDFNKRMLRQTVGSVGPAGLLLADDSEMYERNQRGVQALRPEWLDLGRGKHRERTDESGRLVGWATDETPQRAIWRHYLTLMRS